MDDTNPPLTTETPSPNLNAEALSEQEGAVNPPPNLAITVDTPVTVQQPDPTRTEKGLGCLVKSLEILGIPIVLAVATFWFQQQSEEANQRIAQNNRESETLNAYIDSVALLLSGSDFAAASATDKGKLIRAKSLTTLRQVDGDRKGRIVRFLHEQGLVFTPSYLEADEVQEHETVTVPSVPVPPEQPALSATSSSIPGKQRSSEPIYVSLGGADLVNVDLSAAPLHDIDLSSAIIKNGDLRNTSLVRANLTKTNLIDANLAGADLTNADLAGANLTGAEYTDATTSEETCTKKLARDFPCPTQFPENFDPVAAGLELRS